MSYFDTFAKDRKYLAEFGNSPEINASHFMSDGTNAKENVTLIPSIT
jgi:hypothetical protein